MKATAAFFLSAVGDTEGHGVAKLRGPVINLLFELPAINLLRPVLESLYELF